jgi:hypothetical protein
LLLANQVLNGLDNRIGEKSNQHCVEGENSGDFSRLHLLILVESYYSEGITGRDKPTKAQSFCAAVTTGDQVKNLCEFVDCDGVALPEFEIIMKAIFNAWPIEICLLVRFISNVYRTYQ